MKLGLRHYGVNDEFPIESLEKVGAEFVVTLVPNKKIGEVWTKNDIVSTNFPIKKKTNIEWKVCESIPIHEDIKLGTKNFKEYTKNFIESMKELAEVGVEIICYNFMPVVDWTRTSVDYKLPNGSKTLRFDSEIFSVFDLFILERSNALEQYSKSEIKRAGEIFSEMSEQSRKDLTKIISTGLPGSVAESHDIEGLRKTIDRYKGLSKGYCQNNLKNFLNTVLPVAESLGIKLAMHPDDPALNIFGLPRLMSTEDDIKYLLDISDSPSNGLTVCTGSFGSNKNNDLGRITKTYSDKIYFAHLRNIKRGPGNSFYESGHITGDLNMSEIVHNLISGENKRKTKEGFDWETYVRPDHGLDILGDSSCNQPGYPLWGRALGLAELKGLMKGINYLEEIYNSNK